MKHEFNECAAYNYNDDLFFLADDSTIPIFTVRKSLDYITLSMRGENIKELLDKKLLATGFRVDCSGSKESGQMTG